MSPMPTMDWETFEIRCRVAHDVRLRLAWTIMEYCHGSGMDNIPVDCGWEVKLLAHSTPTYKLKEMTKHIIAMRDYEEFKSRFGIDYSPVSDYLEQDDVSALEGWLFARRSDDAPFEIRKYEADPHQRFASDVEAASYVAWRASMGSEFHREVLQAVGADLVTHGRRVCASTTVTIREFASENRTVHEAGGHDQNQHG